MKNIEVVNPLTRESLVLKNNCWTGQGGCIFKWSEGAYRFVEDDNYTRSFGFQWNRFQKTQLDRFQESSVQSRERFFAATGWDKEDLTNLNVLEVGSGAGRFSQIILNFTQANLYSVDYSQAVEANYKNNGPNSRLHLFQASIYELPFSVEQFDKVVCFGVLQHTPNVKQSMKCLVDMVRPGGELVVDFYPIKGWYTKVHGKYIFRPLTKRLTQERLLKWIERWVDGLIAMYFFFEKLGMGKWINRFLPVCDIKRTIPHGLDKKSLREWVVLDTFDMFSPQYDHPQKLDTVINWAREFGMKQIEGKVVPYGHGNEITVVKAIK